MTPERPLVKLAIPIPEMTAEWPRIEAQDSIRNAAKIIGEAGSAGAILIDEGAEVGAVTAGDLLKTLARDEDSVTGLPRSGPLRDWLAGKLRSGLEVSIVFIDLDSFGEINRAFGHTEGDQALARAAEAIRSSCEERDFPARFGGDEFVVGTLRSRTEAEALAAQIAASLADVRVPGSTGVSGGRRAEPRAEANLGSVVEELLRLASVACLESKQHRG